MKSALADLKAMAQDEIKLIEAEEAANDKLGVEAYQSLVPEVKPTKNGAI